MGILRIFGILCVTLTLYQGCKKVAPDEKAPIPKTPLDIEPVVNPVRDLIRSEDINQEIQKAFKRRFLKGLKNQSAEKVKSSFAADFSGQLYSPKASEYKTEGDIDHWITREALGAFMSAEEITQALMKIVGKWASVDLVDWHVFRVRADKRRPSSRAIVRGHLSLGGTWSNGHREELYASVTCEFVRNEKGHWRIRKLRFDDQTRALTRTPTFRDIATITGFKFNTPKDDKKWQQAVINERHLFTNGGMTALDYNRDGFADIIATQGENETILFLNDKEGGFERKQLPLITSPERVSKFYSWIDLDNDGQEELIGERIIASNSGSHEIPIYKINNGEMSESTKRLRFKTESWLRKISFESIIPCDVNGDQLLDLFFVGYSHNDSNRQPSFISATDGMRNLLFINKGNLQFEEQALTRGLTETKYSLVAACYDFDKDGDDDIFVGNDFGSNDYYVNDGTGNFSANTQHPFFRGSSFSMGLSIADFDNTGHYSVSVSNMYSHAGNRIVPLVEEFKGHDSKDILRLAGGNSLYEYRDNKWADTGVDRNINVSGWAWANHFFDFDNDGDKDLFVTNGNNTHTDPHLPDF